VTTLATRRPARNSTTAHTLRRLRTVLLALTVLVLATSFTVFEGVHQTTTSAAGRTIPAIMAVSAAAQALAEADGAAVHSFSSGEVLITGPGGGYQAQTSLAGQNLEQLAETSEAGDQASQQLLLIDSQLAEYRQLIEQAHADYAAGSTQLGVVEMIYASQLMHGSVLPELDKLRTLHLQAIADQASSFWMSFWATLTWLLPILALVLVLGKTLRYLSVRFRRTVNGSLAGAAVLLLLLGGGTLLSLQAETRFGEARAAVEQLARDRTPTFAPTGLVTQISDKLNLQCRATGTTCGEVTTAADHPAQVAQATRASERAGAATETYGLEFIIPALGLAIGVLVLLGLQNRIQEYRNRLT
jgi:hypothetical protein